MSRLSLPTRLPAPRSAPRSSARSAPRPGGPLTAVVAAAVLLLAGCGSSEDTADADAAAAAPLIVSDAWVKVAESDMTAAFGMIHNTGDTPITITSATTSASDRTELHEVVEQDGQMVMQPKEGGFEIPAGGMLELAPGGLHIMIMDLQQPIAAGDEVTVDLTLGDGSTVEFTALAKETTAGEENYDSGDDMGDMDMGDDAGTSETP